MFKQYKLGYNPVRYENSFEIYARQPRNSVGAKMHTLRKEQSERKKKRYFKAQDWSQYVQIPR